MDRNEMMESAHVLGSRGRAAEEREWSRQGEHHKKTKQNKVLRKGERSTGRWVSKEDVVHTYNVILFSHKKTMKQCHFSKMDGPWDDHTKWSKLERGRPILYDITCMWHKWAYLQNRNRLTDIENRCADAKGKGVGEEWIRSWGLADAKYYI